MTCSPPLLLSFEVKILVVVLVIAVGSMRVQSDNWLPFFPNGISATMQSAATLSYAFIGYDVRLS